MRESKRFWFLSCPRVCLFEVWSCVMRTHLESKIVLEGTLAIRITWRARIPSYGIVVRYWVLPRQDIRWMPSFLKPLLLGDIVIGKIIFKVEKFKVFRSRCSRSARDLRMVDISSFELKSVGKSLIRSLEATGSCKVPKVTWTIFGCSDSELGSFTDRAWILISIAL